ncbi:MAG: MFS transporter [Blastocatellia bacterium]
MGKVEMGSGNNFLMQTNNTTAPQLTQQIKSASLSCAGICLVIDGFECSDGLRSRTGHHSGLAIAERADGLVFEAPYCGRADRRACAMLQDRFGRRPVLLATLFFAAMTLVTAQASSVGELRWIRLIAGIGLGGIMPNAVALCGEFSPPSARVFVMMLVSNGFTAGARQVGLSRRG